MKQAQRIWVVIWAFFVVFGLIGMIWNPSHIFTALAAIMLLIITAKEYNNNEDE